MRNMKSILLVLALQAGLVACATKPPVTAPSAAPEAAPQARTCPEGLPAGTRCLSGTDSAGAPYLVALPKDWTGTLVLHAHGGPHLETPPRLSRTEADLRRWSVVVRAGHAWAGSVYRDGGVAVRSAAEDTERLRRIFLQHVAVPARTVLHGQSWGAGVAAMAAQMFTHTTEGKAPYDAVLLTSGVLGGGTRSYDFRLDLRVVYQYLCANHPRPDEPAYPLAIGLPANATLTPSELELRARDCLGLDIADSARSAEQAQRLRTIERVIGVPASSLQQHLRRATFDFQDIVQRRTGGLSPFGNVGARYRGSDNDEALNASVLRYKADPSAVQRFGADADPSGHIPVPVLAVHAIHDPIAFVELEHQFRETMKAAGTADHLVQVYTEHREHSYLADPVYPAAIQQLLAWATGGAKPTQASVAEACKAQEAVYGAGCRMVVGFEPLPLDRRVTPRQRP